MQQTSSPANLICIDDVELLVMKREDFNGLMADFDEIRRLWILCPEVEMGKDEDRVTQLITSDSTERYLDFVNSYPVYAQ